jgi:hypothetical protein
MTALELALVVLGVCLAYHLCNWLADRILSVMKWRARRRAQ